MIAFATGNWRAGSIVRVVKLGGTAGGSSPPYGRGLGGGFGTGPIVGGGVVRSILGVEEGPRRRRDHTRPTRTKSCRHPRVTFRRPSGRHWSGPVTAEIVRSTPSRHAALPPQRPRRSCPDTLLCHSRVFHRPPARTAAPGFNNCAVRGYILHPPVIEVDSSAISAGRPSAARHREFFSGPL